jgi:hypothetical protein
VFPDGLLQQYPGCLLFKMRSILKNSYPEDFGISENQTIQSNGFQEFRKDGIVVEKTANKVCSF